MKKLLLGAKGQLGSTLEKSLQSSTDLISCSRQQADLKDHAALRSLLDTVKPDVIINAAAYTAVDAAETNHAEAYAVNAEAVRLLAEEATKRNCWLVHYSTDYVFDGQKNAPYQETDPPNPINIYGASKLAGEQAILQSGCKNLIFRTSWVIGAHGQNFATTILRLAAEREELSVVNDQRGAPTSPALIAKVTAAAVQDITAGRPWPHGLYHLAAKGETSWYELAELLMELAMQANHPLTLKKQALKPVTSVECQSPAKRPANSRLSTNRLEQRLNFPLPHWREDFTSTVTTLIRGRMAA